MEMVNEVKLVGIVHQVTKKGAALNLAVLTTYCYKDTAGFPCIEDTWHSVVTYKDIEVRKGDTVKVLGRLRNTAYVSPDGTERAVTTIIAKEIETNPKTK